jgi:hypothetical protein
MLPNIAAFACELRKRGMTGQAQVVYDYYDTNQLKSITRVYNLP